MRFLCDECEFITDSMNKLNSHKKFRHEDIGLVSEVARLKSELQALTDGYDEVNNHRWSDSVTDEVSV